LRVSSFQATQKATCLKDARFEWEMLDALYTMQKPLWITCPSKPLYYRIGEKERQPQPFQILPECKNLEESGNNAPAVSQTPVTLCKSHLS